MRRNTSATRRTSVGWQQAKLSLLSRQTNSHIFICKASAPALEWLKAGLQLMVKMEISQMSNCQLSFRVGDCWRDTGASLLRRILNEAPSGECFITKQLVSFIGPPKEFSPKWPFMGLWCWCYLRWTEMTLLFSSIRQKYLKVDDFRYYHLFLFVCVCLCVWGLKTF